MEVHIHRSPRPPSWLVFAPGGFCVLLGILILVVPQLLVLLVAGGLILVGSLLLSLAWRFRSSGPQAFRSIRDQFSSWGNGR